MGEQIIPSDFLTRARNPIIIVIFVFDGILSAQTVQRSTNETTYPCARDVQIEKVSVSFDSLATTLVPRKAVWKFFVFFLNLLGYYLYILCTIMIVTKIATTAVREKTRGVSTRSRKPSAGDTSVSSRADGRLVLVRVSSREALETRLIHVDKNIKRILKNLFTA